MPERAVSLSGGHAYFTTIASCTNDTTVHACYEGLAKKVWCCSTSALCQTRDRVNQSPLSTPGSEAEEADEEDGILEYDSSSSEDVDDKPFSTYNDAAYEDGGGIPSLDREATLFAWNGLTFRKNCSLQSENYGLNAANC